MLEPLTTETTLAKILKHSAGGVIATGRGDGNSEVRYLGEQLDEELANAPVTLVSREEDGEAWRLGCDALTALNIVGEPQFVALGARGEGSNPHQEIFVA